MKRLVALLVALLPLAALSRPLLIAPKHLSLPFPVEPQYDGQFAPEYLSTAIDGDTLLVAANRAINANDDRVTGVYRFQRASNGDWSYAGPLVEGLPYTSMLVRLQGNLAVVTHTTALLVFERGTGGWTQTATIPRGPPLFADAIRVDDGAFFVHRHPGVTPSCSPPYQVYRKVSGTWQVVATIGEQRCTQSSLDVNEARALVVTQPAEFSMPQTPPPVYADTGVADWPRVASIPLPPPLFGVGAGTISSGRMYFGGGFLYRNTGGNNWVSAGRHTEPEVELGLFVNEALLRGPYLFTGGGEIDYWLRSDDEEAIEEWKTVRVYRPNAGNGYDYYARLNPDSDLYQWAPSEDGRRVAALGPPTLEGFSPTRLYVFEIPDNATIPSALQDNFQSGNLARWTPFAGQFAVTQSGVTRVMNQSSTSGDAGAFVTAVDWTDQAIEADMRPLEFAGNGRWFGLVTRRTDGANFYYVTFRAPRGISLRRMRNGVFTELAAARSPVDFVVGKSYRVRLESAGDQHVVFLNGVPRVHVKDSTLSRGHPGVAGYRTRFQTDNVVLTGSTRLLLRSDIVDRTPAQTPARTGATGTWDYFIGDTFFTLRQSDNTGDARWFSRVAVGNQVISARLRPLSFGPTTGAQDPWVGIAARVADQNNYVYLTLRRSGQLSLRKLVNGSIQQIAAVPQTLTPGTWYDLRLEVIGNSIRAHVNGDLRIEANDATIPGSGRNAVLMYKTAADLTNYIAYLP